MRNRGIKNAGVEEFVCSYEHVRKKKNTQPSVRRSSITNLMRRDALDTTTIEIFLVTNHYPSMWDEIDLQMRDMNCAKKKKKHVSETKF